MKFRMDFVSNSSSSSFIGAFAKISDTEKAMPIIKKYKLESYIRLGEDILREITSKKFMGYGADWANVDLTPEAGTVNKDAKYILWESWGGAGEDDTSFYNEEFDTYDHTVVLSDFKEEEQNIYNNIKEENGFSDIIKDFGSGRSW